jgi:hypothetical protein
MFNHSRQRKQGLMHYRSCGSAHILVVIDMFSPAEVELRMSSIVHVFIICRGKSPPKKMIIKEQSKTVQNSATY